MKSRGDTIAVCLIVFMFLGSIVLSFWLPPAIVFSIPSGLILILALFEKKFGI